MQGALCTGNVAGFLKGLQYVPELQASIMQPFVPVLVMAVSAGMGIQQIGLRGKTGVVMRCAPALPCSMLLYKTPITYTHGMPADVSTG